MGDTKKRKPFPQDCYFQSPTHAKTTSSTTARPNFSALYDRKSQAPPWMQTCYDDSDKPKTICIAQEVLREHLIKKGGVSGYYLEILELFHLNGFNILIAIKDEEGNEKLYKVDSWPIPRAILEQAISLPDKKVAKLAHQRDPHCARENLYFLKGKEMVRLMHALGMVPFQMSLNSYASPYIINHLFPNYFSERKTDDSDEAQQSTSQTEFAEFMDSLTREWPSTSLGETNNQWGVNVKDFKKLRDFMINGNVNNKKDLNKRLRDIYYIFQIDNLCTFHLHLNLDLLSEHELQQICLNLARVLPDGCKVNLAFFVSEHPGKIEWIHPALNAFQARNMNLNASIFNQTKKHPDYVGDVTVGTIKNQHQLDFVNKEDLGSAVRLQLDRASSLNELSIETRGFIDIDTNVIADPLFNLRSVRLSQGGMQMISFLEFLQKTPNLEFLSLQNIQLFIIDQPAQLIDEYVLKLLELKNLHTLIIDEDMLKPEAVALLRHQKKINVTINPSRLQTRQDVSQVQHRWSEQVVTGQPISQPKPDYGYIVEIDDESVSEPDLELDATNMEHFQQKPYFSRFPASRGGPKNIRQKAYQFHPVDCRFTPQPEQYTPVDIVVGHQLFDIRRITLNVSPYSCINYNAGVEKTFKAGERVAFYTESPNDELLMFAIDRTVNAEFTVERGSNGLFYVTASQDIPGKVNCQFLLGTPKLQGKAEKFPPVLQGLEERIAQFGYGNEDLDEDQFATNESKIQAVLERKKGACRHRAQAFIYEFNRIRNEQLAQGDESLQDYEVRMVEGSGHAWIEWRPSAKHEFIVRDNLGGYPAVSTYQEQEAPKGLDAYVIEDYDGSKRVEKQPKTPLSIEPLNLNQYVKEDYDPEKRTQETPPLPDELPLQQDDDFFTVMRQLFQESMNGEEQPRQLEKKTNPKRFSSCEEVAQLFDLPIGYNQLLCFSNEQEQSAFIQALQQKRPGEIFHAYSAKRLRYEMPGLEQSADDKQWFFSSRSKGDLQLYLQSLPEGKRPIIILNLHPSDLVKYNTIMDPNVKNRHINGHPIPENAIIITVLTNNSPALDDNSVLSRQHWRHQASMPRESVSESDQGVALSAPLSHSLYHSADWYALLVGYAGYNDKGEPTVFPGLLMEAIEKRSPLILTHLPSHDPEFAKFIQDVNANKGFWFLNQWYDFPQGIILNESAQYVYDDVGALVDAVHFGQMEIDTTQANHHVVTAHTFERCLRNIVVENDKFYQHPGWVAAAHHSQLTLLIMENLSEGQWRCLFDECRKHHVQLNLYVPLDVAMPSELQAILADKVDDDAEEEPAQRAEHPSRGGFVYADANAESLGQFKDALIIDASELNDEDVLYRYSVSYDEDGKPHAEYHPSDLLGKLIAGETVVLKGNIPAVLIGHLATLFVDDPYLWINGEKVEIPGRLILMPENTINNLPTMYDQGRYVDCEKDGVFYPGFTDNPSDTSNVHMPIHPENYPDPHVWWSEQAYVDVMQQREACVLKQLQVLPFVFLEGNAGSGKTSLMLGIKEHNPQNVCVFYEDDLMNWANEPQDGKQKILFIDEANLRESQHWTMFEGLFNQPPTLYYKGKLYELTDEHKVVFAGNPLSHGGGCHIPTLFKRHPAAVIQCPSLSKPYIEHAIIRDIFKHIPESLGIDPIEAGREFLEAYNLSAGHIRDLQSKAILHVQQLIAGNANIEAERFSSTPDYTFVDSRRTPMEHLHRALAIHEFKSAIQQSSEGSTLLDAACYGGHSGLLLQGAPDTGKTALMIAGLKAAGYQRVTLDTPAVECREKVYYEMDPNHIDAILDKAFNEGAIVVWDELNTSITPALTAKLNAYLSGHDLSKNPPQRPGFTLLSSINPAYLQGRTALGAALLSRLIVDDVSKYTTQDFRDILAARAEALSESAQNKIFDHFLEKRAAAKAERKPMPGTRYLLGLIQKQLSQPEPPSPPEGKSRFYPAQSPVVREEKPLPPIPTKKRGP